MDGARHFPGVLDLASQNGLLAAIRTITYAAPFYTPRMPRSDKPFSVRMTNCGPLGWVSDKRGYRYQPMHPETRAPWPPMPPLLTELWQRFSGCPCPAEACLINHYAPGTRMGSHQDRDEQDFSAPVLSISLGDDAVFHVGGLRRGDAKTRYILRSGDIFVLGGGSRLAYHGIDSVIAGTSALLEEGGRINLTMRRVTKTA